MCSIRGECGLWHLLPPQTPILILLLEGYYCTGPSLAGSGHIALANLARSPIADDRHALCCFGLWHMILPGQPWSQDRAPCGVGATRRAGRSVGHLLGVRLRQCTRAIVQGSLAAQKPSGSARWERECLLRRASRCRFPSRVQAQVAVCFAKRPHGTLHKEWRLDVACAVRRADRCALWRTKV